MSLATICQNVAADLGIDDPPTPIFGSKMPAARRLVAQLRRAQWALLRRAQWAATVVEYDFTATGTSDYPMPPDLLKIVNDTVWERSRYWQMRGVLSPQQWQLYKSSIYGRATLWRRWRVRVPGADGQVGTAPVFSIDPSLSSRDETSKFVYEYQSAWGIRQAGTGQMVPDWTGDDDTSILDEMLLELGTRWRMARRIGLAYDEERDEYEREVDKAVARDGGTATLNLVPWSRFDDWIGQYTLAAFPPVGPGSGQPPNQPFPSLPPDIAGLVAPFERPLPPSDDGTDEARARVLAAWAAATAPPLAPGAPPRAPLVAPPAMAWAGMPPRVEVPPSPVGQPALARFRSGTPLPPAARPYPTVMPTTRRLPPMAEDDAARAQVSAAWAAAAAQAPQPAPEPPVIRVGTPLIGGRPPRQWPPGTLGI